MNNPTTATAPASKRTMTTKTLAYCALLAALSVVLARLIIPMPNVTTRFSIEAVPIYLAGMLFGQNTAVGGAELNHQLFAVVMCDQGDIHMGSLLILYRLPPGPQQRRALSGDALGNVFIGPLAVVVDVP